MAIKVEGHRGGEPVVCFGTLWQRADGGFHFTPWQAGRRGSRRSWPSADAALPAWVTQTARKQGWQVVFTGENYAP